MFCHWAMKRGRARLAISRIDQIDSGTVVKATRVSNGEIVSIITATPTSISTDLRSWLRVCWRLWDRLSMSFVTRLRRSPRECPSM